ncbi:MAG: RsiV family protein [Christensenellales bacterium]|jgi:hypothetical protein
MYRAGVFYIVVIWILLFIAIGTVLVYFSRKPVLSKRPVSKQSALIYKDIEIAEETENYGAEYLTTDISKPIVSGLSNVQFEKSLNDSIAGQISAAHNAAKEAAALFWQQAESQGYTPWAYVFYANYSVKSADRILSLKVMTLLDTGGPGLPSTAYYNIDIQKNKLIALSDLFSDDTYKEIINTIITNEMAKDTDRYFAADSFTGVSNKTAFFICEGKLYIAFAKYQIASGMTGEPSFLIPNELILNIIAPEYMGLFK